MKRRKLSEVNKRVFAPEEYRTSSEYWDLWRDGLSPSAMLAFLNCREQFRIAWVEGWRTPRQYSFHKEWGSLFHYVHKQWVTGKYRSLKRCVRKWKARFEERVIMTPKIAEQQEFGYALMRATWPTYKKMYADDRNRDWFLYESTLKADCEGVPVVGQVDGGWHEKSGACLHEMKTHAQINPRHFADSLHLDLQMMTYLWLMKKEEGKVKMGQKDVIRRSSATPSKTRRESLVQFTERIAADIKKRPSYYFMRFQLEEINDSIDEWEKMVLRPIIDTVRNWVEKRVPHFPTGVHALIPRPWGSEYFDPVVLQDYSEMSREKAYSYHEKE